MTAAKPRSQKRRLPAVLSLRVNPDEMKRIDEAAARKGMKRSAFIRSVLVAACHAACALCNDTGYVNRPLPSTITVHGANGYISMPCPNGCSVKVLNVQALNSVGRAS